MLAQAGLAHAGTVVIATPDAVQAQLITEHVRRVNPGVHLIARTHDEHTRRALWDLGATEVLYSEHELGQALGEHAVSALTGRATPDPDAVPSPAGGYWERARPSG